MEVSELFEGSSPLARRLESEGPFASPAAMIAAARRVKDLLTESEKIATLDAHPRIGERSERLSAASLREQGTEVLAELDSLNERYESRFGFRFVIHVNRRSKAAILEMLRLRVENDRDQELATGLQAVVDIAQDRLAQDRLAQDRLAEGEVTGA